MDALFIDIGSNTIKSLLAKFENGRVMGIAENSVATRISDDASLVPDAVEIIERAVKELIGSASGLSSAFETVCFGTSALREFADAKEVLDSLYNNGIKIRVLSGEEEASLSFRGALTDMELNLADDEKVVYADLGGGSMEFVIGTTNGANSARSLPLGAVRLTKMFRGDPEKISEFCRATLKGLPNPNAAFRLVIAGGAVTAARFILGGGTLSANTRISLEDLGKVLKTSVDEGADGLSEKFGTPKNRADILPAAFVCLIETLKFFGKTEFTHTQHSLRYGVAEEFFNK